MDFALSVLGQSRGGAAKVAVTFVAGVLLLYPRWRATVVAILGFVFLFISLKMFSPACKPKAV
jgi:Na+/phosphate symporter